MLYGGSRVVLASSTTFFAPNFILHPKYVIKLLTMQIFDVAIGALMPLFEFRVAMKCIRMDTRLVNHAICMLLLL